MASHIPTLKPSPIADTYVHLYDLGQIKLHHTLRVTSNALSYQTQESIEVQSYDMHIKRIGNI